MFGRRILVLGGGFFGCWISDVLAERKHSVTLIERREGLMMGASLKNQARIHGGYHYPRSFATALACRRQFQRFAREFEACVRRPVHSLYAIARKGSLIDSARFCQLCRRIGAPLEEADPSLKRLFSRELVESVYEVEEPVFDAIVLKNTLEDRMNEHGVAIHLKEEACELRRHNDCLEVRMSNGAVEKFDDVIACLYDSTNKFLMSCHLPPVPLEIECVELALVEPPSVLQDVGITVMDGPFWSLMPFPIEGKSSLSHVRYTPYHRGKEDSSCQDVCEQPLRSSCGEMLLDAMRFVPALSSARQTGSIFAKKAILPRSAQTDSRPIALIKDHALQGLHVVIGSKLDAVFDLESELN